MNYNLGGKKIDLSQLGNYITGFFQKNDFFVSISSIHDGYKIIAKPKTYSNIKEKITVKIKGQPNSFSVTFDAKSFLGKFTILGNLLTLFFGGYLLLRELKSRENLEKFEREFWIYVNNVVEKLIGDSAPLS